MASRRQVVPDATDVACVTGRWRAPSVLIPLKCFFLTVLYQYCLFLPPTTCSAVTAGYSTPLCARLGRTNGKITSVTLPGCEPLVLSYSVDGYVGRIRPMSNGATWDCTPSIAPQDAVCGTPAAPPSPPALLSPPPPAPRPCDLSACQGCSGVACSGCAAPLQVQCCMRDGGSREACCAEQPFAQSQPVCTGHSPPPTPVAPPPPPEACNQQNKQKALYHSFEHSPTLEGATDVIGDVIWDDLDGLRAYGNRGLFSAWTITFLGTDVPSGYCGPQATGAARAGDPNLEQVLFSLWDGGDVGSLDAHESWWPALPLLPDCDALANPGQACCKRNCQDCAVYGSSDLLDGSTGTQCKVYIPTYTGQRVRTRIRRIAQATTSQAYGRSWVGDEWEVCHAIIRTDALFFCSWGVGMCFAHWSLWFDR